jgi:hypothetical protein
LGVGFLGGRDGPRHGIGSDPPDGQDGGDRTQGDESAETPRSSVRHVTSAHLLAFAVAVGAIGALTLAAGWAALGRRISRSIVDAGVVIVLVAVGLGAASGLILPTQGPGPADPLHALYAVAALLTVPVARLIGARRDPPRGRDTGRGLGRWLLAGGAITLGLLVRLWQTG